MPHPIPPALETDGHANAAPNAPMSIVSRTRTVRSGVKIARTGRSFEDGKPVCREQGDPGANMLCGLSRTIGQIFPTAAKLARSISLEKYRQPEGQWSAAADHSASFRNRDPRAAR